MNDMSWLQQRTIEVGSEVFGEANVKDKRERALRFGEEAMELCRAAGLSFKELASLLCYEFQRPAGNIRQEVAGVQCTLFGLASAHDIDVRSATIAELLRVKEKKAECRAKHDAKPSILTNTKVTAA